MILKEISSGEIIRFDNFVKNSYIKSAASFNFFKKFSFKLRNNVLTHHADFLLKYCKFLVLEEEGVIFAWVAFIEEETEIIIYFCYTKYPFRQKGLMGSLLKNLRNRNKFIYYCLEKNIQNDKLFEGFKFKGGVI